MKGILNRQY